MSARRVVTSLETWNNGHGGRSDNGGQRVLRPDKAVARSVNYVPTDERAACEWCPFYGTRAPRLPAVGVQNADRASPIESAVAMGIFPPLYTYDIAIVD